MNYLSEQRIATDENLAPTRQTFLKIRKQPTKNPLDQSINRDKSPKTRLYKELSQLVSIYTPLNVQANKKRNNIVSNSFINKRTITEMDDKLGNQPYIQQQEEQMNSQNLNISKENIISYAPMANQKEQPNIQRKNRSIVNPMKLSISHDKHPEKFYDLPQLNPTPKGSNDMKIDKSGNDYKKREFMNISPSNQLQLEYNPYNNNPQSCKANLSQNKSNRLKTLSGENKDKRKSIVTITSEDQYSSSNNQYDIKQQNSPMFKQIIQRDKQFITPNNQSRKFVFPQRQQSINNNKKRDLSNNNSRATSPFMNKIARKTMHQMMNKIQGQIKVQQQQVQQQVQQQQSPNHQSQLQQQQSDHSYNIIRYNNVNSSINDSTSNNYTNTNNAEQKNQIQQQKQFQLRQLQVNQSNNQSQIISNIQENIQQSQQPLNQVQNIQKNKARFHNNFNIEDSNNVHNSNGTDNNNPLQDKDNSNGNNNDNNVGSNNVSTSNSVMKNYSSHFQSVQQNQVPSQIVSPKKQANPKQNDKKENKSSRINTENQQDSNNNTLTPLQQRQSQLIHPKILWDMSDEEWNSFGDRFPANYEKKKLLGRGGFALVWLGQHKQTKEQFAVKQILTTNAHQTHIKEIWFGSYFFEKGIPKKKYSNYQGMNNLCKMMSYEIKPLDTWIFYELCGESLGNSLYELKGEGNIGNERVYRIHYKPLYLWMRKDIRPLKKLILDLAQSLWVLSDCRIVHSDVKTENILIKSKKNKDGSCEVTDVKLIDFGSSFTFGNLKHFSMATPEYMAPEILNFILYQNNLRYLPKLLGFLKNYEKTYVIDVWSLGCVILEIVSGLPLWMSLKTIISSKQQELIRCGLFAAKGRVFEAIIERQLEVVKNLDHYIDEENYSGILIDEDIRYLLKRMLTLNPEQRISPSEIVDYLTDKKVFFSKNTLLSNNTTQETANSNTNDQSHTQTITSSLQK